MAKPKIVICMGSSCFARGNEKTVEVCESFLAARGLKDEVDVDLGASRGPWSVPPTRRRAITRAAAA